MTHHQDRVSFLTSALGAHVKNRFTELLAPLGLAPPHYGTLRWLSEAEGSTQQEIADRMQVRRSVMVGLVDDLEVAGLVTRGRHPADRRANALHLTPTGKRTLARADRLADSLDAELLAPLDDSQRAPFRAALRLLSAATGLNAGVFPEVRGSAPATHAHA